MLITSCTTVNECANAALNNCDANAACTKTVGSFTCTCNVGYVGNGTSCSNINECSSDKLNNCDVNAECNDNDGSFSCTCKAGYAGNGTFCSFIAGGFSVNGDFTAVVVNQRDKLQFLAECTAVVSNNGGTDAVCLDVSGDESSITVQLGGSSTAIDAAKKHLTLTSTGLNLPSFGDLNFLEWNQCLTAGYNNCNANAECINTVGGFDCRCRQGYSGDGRSCTEVAETTLAATTTVARPTTATPTGILAQIRNW